MDMGRVPEVICTDPDGNSEADIEKEILACSRGSIVLIHAHGDNMDKLEKYVPRFRRFIATTQASLLIEYTTSGGSVMETAAFLLPGISELKVSGSQDLTLKIP